VGMDVEKRVVTLGGECFEAEFEREETALPNRIGTYHLFRLHDVRSGRGERLVSVFNSEQVRLLNENYKAHLEIARINVIRRAFDAGNLNFDEPYDKHTYKTVDMKDGDFKRQPVSSDLEIRQFMIQEAFWLSYMHPTHPGQPINFETPVDLDYLGAAQADIRRNILRLQNQKMLDKVMDGSGRPTETLLTAYEARQSTPIGSERYFAKNTQYDAYKIVSAIFRAARDDIFITDNYLDDSVLDMLMSAPSQPSVKLLTFKPSADFKIAVKRFRSQYKKAVEVRLHQREIHDRAIVVDDKDFYTFGASIKDLGRQLSVLNKLEDSTNVAKLRAELQTIWASAQPLS